MAETDVVYTFRAEDKISGPMKKAEEQLNRTEEASHKCTQAQQSAILKSVEVMTALQAVQSGLSAVTSSVRTLGIVDEETALTLQKVTAGVQLVVGQGSGYVIPDAQLGPQDHRDRVHLRGHRGEPRQGCARHRRCRLGCRCRRRLSVFIDAEQ